MISSDSRYTSAVIQVVTAPNGATRQEIRVPFPKVKVFNFTFYRVTSADRIDTLAHRFYGNGTLWWKIADANPEILDWSHIPLGAVLRIPSD